MKKTIVLTLLLVAGIFSSTIYFSACTADPCKTRAVTCMNGGTCKDGDCICAKGYEGDSCQFRINEKFNSHYACIRTRLINNSFTDDNDDSIRIKALNDKFSVKIYSIRDSIFEVLNASVEGNTLTIPDQNIDFLGTIYKYNGNGSLNNGVLTMTVYKDLISGTSIWSAKTTYVGYKYE